MGGEHLTHLARVGRVELAQLHGGVVGGEARGPGLDVGQPIALQAAGARPVEQDEAAREVGVQRALEREQLALLLAHHLDTGQVERVEGFGEGPVRVVPHHDGARRAVLLVEEPAQLLLNIG